MRCLNDLYKYKKRVVEEIDFKIEKIKADVKERMERYFHIKYLSCIEGASCDFTLTDMFDTGMNVYYGGKLIMYFYLYSNCNCMFDNKFSETQEFMQNMKNEDKFKKMKTDMKRIFTKYTSTSYLTILPLAVTLTLCNQYNRIFPKDILNIIIKKLFFILVCFG